MLSIDEAISHAREVAEEQRELFRLCPYPSQECNGADICKCLKNKHDGCIKCAEEHEQLAEWLEELKALREEKSDFQIKQIAKKPTKDKYVPELDFCPECGTEVTNCNYCPYCGQKIKIVE